MAGRKIGTTGRKPADRKSAAGKAAGKVAPTREKAAGKKKSARDLRRRWFVRGDAPPPRDWRFELIVGVKPSALKSRRRVVEDLFVQLLSPLADDFDADRLSIPFFYVTANPRKGTERLCFVVLRRLALGMTLNYVQERLRVGQLDSPFDYIEPNARVRLCDSPLPVGVTTNDKYSRWQWALAAIGADKIQDLPPPNDNAFVAIIDSGLRRPDGNLPDDIHPDSVLPVADCTPPGVNWPYNNVDRYGHGTLLAGTIAASTGNGVGIASPVPESWNSAPRSIQLMPVQFFDVSADPSVAMAVAAIDFAVTNPDVKVINCSWHVGVGGGRESEPLRRAIKNASDHRILVVAAAGNDGVDNGVYPTYPANYGNKGYDGHVAGLKVLTVAASARDDWKAGFSNYSRASASSSGSSLVDIAAPGMHLYSTGKSFTAPSYPLWSGTSAAAALCSVAAALVYTYNPGWSAEDVQQYLKDSADKLPGLRNVCQGDGTNTNTVGNRLSIVNAMKPLKVTEPQVGASILSNRNFTIVWEQKFQTEALNNARVRVEFEKWNNGAWIPRTLSRSVAITPPNLVWQVQPADRGPRCRIRLTTLPTRQANFTVTSDEFEVQ